MRHFTRTFALGSIALMLVAASGRAEDAPTVEYRSGHRKVTLRLATDELMLAEPVEGKFRPTGKLVQIGASGREALRSASLMLDDEQTQSMAVLHWGEEPTDESRVLLSRRLYVRLKPGEALAPLLQAHDLTLVKKLDLLPDTYVLECVGGDLLVAVERANALHDLKATEWASPETFQRRQISWAPDDPLIERQWHLPLISSQAAWDYPVTGQGVTIKLLDDSLETTHEDLEANTPEVSSHLHLDILDSDNDPNPEDYDNDPDTVGDFHGNWVGGAAAAVGGNGIGVTGVAPEGELICVRCIGGWSTEEEFASGLSWQIVNGYTDVCNNSWGPGPFNPDAYAKPGPLEMAALEDAGKRGRAGKGTIFTWAAGNDNEINDANWDGWKNTRWGITVGCSGPSGEIAYYSEHSASLLVNAPGDGTGSCDPMGVWGMEDGTGGTGSPDGNYTYRSNGTSTATPIVSGVVALMLDANPSLTYRDVRAILIESSTKNSSDDWLTNGAGYTFSHTYGYGRVDAAAAVNLASQWENLPPQATTLAGSSTGSGTLPAAIPDAPNPNGITSAINISQVGRAPEFKVEFVEWHVQLRHTWRSDLEFKLISPGGMTSIVQPFRYLGGDTVMDWTFGSVAHFGEQPFGDWRLQVIDHASGDTGTLEYWSIKIHGYVSGAEVTLATTDSETVEWDDSNLGKFEVRLDSPATTDVAVRVTLGGTAAPGVDYQLLNSDGTAFEPNRTVTIHVPAGHDRVPLRVKPINDELAEDDEAVTLTLNSIVPDSYQIGLPMSGTVLIADNDGDRPIKAVVVRNASEEGEKEGIFELQRGRPTDFDRQIFFTVSGNASVPDDYALEEGLNNVVMRMGTSAARVRVVPVDDRVIEAKETVVLTIVSGQTYAVGDPESATMFIGENDAEPLPFAGGCGGVPGGDGAPLAPLALLLVFFLARRLPRQSLLLGLGVILIGAGGCQGEANIARGDPLSDLERRFRQREAELEVKQAPVIVTHREPLHTQMRPRVGVLSTLSAEQQYDESPLFGVGVDLRRYMNSRWSTEIGVDGSQASSNFTDSTLMILRGDVKYLLTNPFTIRAAYIYVLGGVHLISDFAELSYDRGEETNFNVSLNAGVGVRGGKVPFDLRITASQIPDSQNVQNYMVISGGWIF